MVVQQSLGLAERLRAFGPGRDIEVQDAMARVTLDVILTTGFDLPSNAVDLDAPCPLLEDMHFLMAETFRCVKALICWSPSTQIAENLYVHEVMDDAGGMHVAKRAPGATIALLSLQK